MLKIQVIPTKPFEGQKPGTSGLRKGVKVFSQANYTENFVQSILTAGLGDALVNSTLVLGGDGRYFSKEAVQIIIKLCAANKVRFGSTLVAYRLKIVTFLGFQTHSRTEWNTVNACCFLYDQEVQDYRRYFTHCQPQPWRP